jgi:hypothetical protein
MSTENYESSDFPVHIDLGRKVPNYDMKVAESAAGKKKKTIYPNLYVEDNEDLGKLEKEGWALIRYKRRSLTIRDPDKDDDDKNRTSASLDVLEICLPENGGDLMDEFKAFAKSKGLGDGAVAPDSDKEPDDDEEET